MEYYREVFVTDARSGLAVENFHFESDEWINPLTALDIACDYMEAIAPGISFFFEIHCGGEN